MVNFWDEHLKAAIARTERRIKIMERNGIGKAAMDEKRILEKQKRKRELRKQLA